MRAFAIVVGLLFASSAAADAPADKQPPAAPAKAATPAATPAPTTCKKVVVGRGLDRKVVCEITAPVVVKAGPPKPEVLIVPRDPRNVVGRPKSENRLNGLSQRRN